MIIELIYAALIFGALIWAMITAKDSIYPCRPNSALKDIAIKTLNIDKKILSRCQKRLKDYNAWYFWNPNINGFSIIIDDNGEKLIGNPDTSFEELYKQFIIGKRN